MAHIHFRSVAISPNLNLDIKSYRCFELEGWGRFWLMHQKRKIVFLDHGWRSRCLCFEVTCEIQENLIEMDPELQTESF